MKVWEPGPNARTNSIWVFGLQMFHSVTDTTLVKNRNVKSTETATRCNAALLVWPRALPDFWLIHY